MATVDLVTVQDLKSFKGPEFHVGKWNNYHIIIIIIINSIIIIIIIDYPIIYTFQSSK